MSALEAIVLGLLQGLTEFLPISSTAHLRVVPALLGWNDPGAAFTAVSQLGTLAAVLVYFRKDLGDLAVKSVRALREGRLLHDRDARMALGIVVGTVPIGVAGVLFSKAIKTNLRSLYIIAATLVLLAVVLLFAERVARHVRGMEQVTFTDAVLVGCAQALALVPGVSRSGVTLTAALLLGLRRDAAARFSFLLSIPAVAAAGLFEMKDVVRGDGFGAGLAVPTAIATVVAFVAGLATIAFLLDYLRKRSTMLFVVYRVALGALLLGLLGAGILQA